MAQQDEKIEEATPQEKKRIATHFLLSSPNGQFKDVLTGLLPSLQVLLASSS